MPDMQASGGGGSMLVPPVAQSATGDRPVGDTVARAQQTTGPAATTTLWPLAPAQPNQVPNQQSQGIPSLAATPAPAHTQGANRYGLYSLFPGGGGGSYVAATPATPGPPTPARAYTTHKVSESLFSAAVGVGMGGYTWGAPTPPPGSPYSPVPVTQLELLAKNLANLAPAAGQQALSLQGVGVNVGNLHHAQHTQHTQHTLNLTGLHHLHHGGLHQNAFSPQLSLVTGGAPTLTINSFSSPNSTNGVGPTTGVLLQEYQSPAGTAGAAGCTVTVNGGASGLINTATSSMAMHGGNQTGNQNVHNATKKREAFLSSQGQPVKLENKSTRTPCLCRNSNSKTKVVHSDVGCSRTLPIASSWNGQDGTGANNGGTSLVKREPLASVPCQVAEVSTSLHATTTSVKIEPVPPKSENGIVVSNATGGTGNIPVGIAVARQRLQHQETSTSMRNVSLSHHTSHHASYHHFQPDNFGSSTAMAVGGTTLVHCGGPGGEERAAHLAIPSGALAPSLSLNSTLNSSLNSTLGSIGTTATDTAATWPPTLWQYPATAAAAMPTEPLNFPQMGVGLQSGLQLVRDPTSGHLLLIHAAEQMQQAVVWPNYANHGGNVAPPSLLLPPPPPSIQVLSDIGGARLVLAESKRKPPSALPIVKIEADCSNSPTTIISTSTESTKALQAVTSVTGALVPEAPLVTTLHYYPHAPALVQISQPEPTHCRSQATSPVSCLTPPPEVPTIHAIEPPLFGVQDASNQTDAPEDTEEPQPLVKQEQNLSPCQIVQSGSNLSTANFEIVASPERICNVVRITTTTTTVNPICGIVTKVDKAENTILNMADCAKYSARDYRGIKAIEHDRFVDEDVCKDDKMFCREGRLGARIIEITEENCDSFHENLEFFARRRDVGADQRNRRNSYTKDEEDVGRKTDLVQDKVEIEQKANDDVAENIEAHRQACPKTSELPSFDEPRSNNETKSTESSTANCESRDNNRNPSSINEIRPQITVKSFDMPNIDCDDQEVQQVVIKQEAEDSCYEVCYETQCELTPVSEKPPKTQEATKRHSVEKSHPGIENVVEKLKKNAAALQEAALPAQRIDEPAEKPTENAKSRRHSETIPKKLHILRSCANSLENVDAEVSSQTTLSEQCAQGQSGRCSPQMEDDGHSLINNKCGLSKECLLSDNNNDRKSNNNNIKTLEDKKPFVRNEKAFYDVTVHIKPKTIWSCEAPLGKLHATSKSDRVDDTSSETKSKTEKQKLTVDLSGLELLSNSIVQLEQGIGQLHPQSDADNEESSISGKVIGQQSENNNNVDRLSVLCALAEQKFMEEKFMEQRSMKEVGDEVTRKSNLESSEDITHGRLLLDFGRGGYPEKDGKRKYLEADDHRSKRFKFDDREVEAGKNTPLDYNEEDVKSRTIGATGRPQEETLKETLRESTKHVVDFTTEKIDTFTDETAIDSEERSLNRDDENSYLNKRGAKPIKDPQVASNEISDELRKNDAYYTGNAKDNFSDGEISESKILSGQSTSCEIDNKRRTSAEERDMRSTHNYKNPRTKLEAKKFIARKGNRDNEDGLLIMNATELDMRVQMAVIQRQYKEKQKELSKLIPKKDDKKSTGRPRKKSHSSSSDHGTVSSPAAPDLTNSPQISPSRPSESPDGAPPPLASAVLTMPRCNVNLVKLGEPKSHIKLLDSIPSIPIPVPPVASPITVLPSGKSAPEDDEKSTGTLGYDTSSPAPTVASSSSASKKRKVGRPKKFMCTSGSTRHLTETIVAKKPKSKSSLVGYVLSSKNRHLQTKQYISKTGYTPLPFKSGVPPLKSQSKTQKIAKTKAKPVKPAKQTPLHNKNVISSIIAEKAKLSQEVKLEKQNSKIKPKLKAEVKVKNWEDDENDVVQPEEPAIQPVKEAPPESAEQSEKEPDKLRHEKSKKKKRKSSTSSSSPNRDRKRSKRRKSLDCKECARDAKAESIVNRCKLTSAHLAIDQLRVLTAMGGLFYAGRLSAVQAPDVYAITLDGERGNRPHIHSREEILRDAIVEVCPSSTKELPPGTRLCAYWSEQYRCLYPGTSVEPLEFNSSLDEKYVSVEFDDGDSGRIALENIRLLQPDYPVVEYDPNPLLSLGKRRRQRSLSEEKRSSNDQAGSSGAQGQTAGNNYFAASSYPAQNITDPASQKSDDAEAERIEEYRERKRTKKRKRKLKRLKTQEGKKKHKKHRSSEEHRKHKHRKHRKHKHKHHSSPSEASNMSDGESSCEQKNEEDPIQSLPSAGADSIAPSLEEEAIQYLPTSAGFIAPSLEAEAIQYLQSASTDFIITSSEEEAIQNLPSPLAGFVTTSSEEEAIQNLSSTSNSFVATSSEKEANQNLSSTSNSFVATSSEEEAIQDLPSTSADFVATSFQSEAIQDLPSTSANLVTQSLEDEAIQNLPSTSAGFVTTSSEEEAIQNVPSTSTGSVATSSEDEVIQNLPSTNTSFVGPSSEDETIQNLPSTSAGFVAPPSEKISEEPQSEQTPEETSSIQSSSEWEPDYVKKKKQIRAKQMKTSEKSADSRSKMAAFLPDSNLWSWADDPYRRIGTKGRYKKQFHKIISRYDETLRLGDSALFLSSSTADRPYIGKIVSMWEPSNGNMTVRVKWYYHPEERKGSPPRLKYPGGLFESNHWDENDIQTIGHKCEVLSLAEYLEKMGDELNEYQTDEIYDSRDVYYNAGTYDPTTYLTKLNADVV